MQQLTELQQKAIRNQKEVIDEAVRHILMTREDIAIVGPAGHGKTYITRLILEKLIGLKKKKVLVATLAHQALGVASQFLEGTLIEYNGSTIASALHCRKVIDQVSGEVKFIPKKKYRYNKGKRTLIKPPISTADYIVIDECSQVSHSQLFQIEQLRKPSSVIIFIGDICQLPPIEKNEGELISPVFNLKTFTLKYPFRYGGEIATIGKLFRDQIMLGLNGKKFDAYVWKQLQDNKSEKIVLHTNKRQFNDEMIFDFKQNELGTKYISYHRYTYQKVGKYIRNKLHPNRKYDYEVNDLVIAKSSYYKDNIPKIYNGQQGFIEGKRKLKLPLIWLKNRGGQKKFYTLDETKYASKATLKMKYAEQLGYALSDIVIEELEYWCHDISNVDFIPTKPVFPSKYKKIIEHLKERDSLHPNSDFSSNWDALDALNSFFCDIQYAYAMTSHTAQGSTYDNVYANFQDIYSSTKTTDLEKLQSAYVAITRAKTKISCLI